MGVPELTPAASAARARARSATGRDGGWTGAELLDVASRVFRQARRLRKTAERRPPGQRRERLERAADEALVTAAVQVRLCERVPAGRPYLHALSLQQIQAAKDDAARAYETDPAALAVDTHRRINAQRDRQRHRENR